MTGSGYDLKVAGIENDTFYAIHIPALICIVISFICVITAFTLSFKSRDYRRFFKDWGKSHKFVVYLAICDGLYNIFHFIDHLHVVIAHDHVRPPALCAAYGFTLVVSISSQNLMVCVVAINAFMLIYFDYNLKFGRYDWRLLMGTFGMAILGAVISAAFGQLGPNKNGAFCYFDGVNGDVGNVISTSIIMILVLGVNTVLYILIWSKIRSQVLSLRKSMDTMPSSMAASHRAAKTMTLFVVAFFVQWSSMVLYGIWQLAGGVPQQWVVHCITVLTNLGGVFNLAVFLWIRRGHKASRNNSTVRTNSVAPTTSTVPLESKVVE